MSGETVAVRIRIHGRVQGVWYRGWAVDEATALALRGWVRNRRDGAVEALLIGPPAAVERMIQTCRKGPPAAQVERIEREATDDDGSVGFSQAPTI